MTELCTATPVYRRRVDPMKKTQENLTLYPNDEKEHRIIFRSFDGTLHLLYSDYLRDPTPIMFGLFEGTKTFFSEIFYRPFTRSPIYKRVEDKDEKLKR